MDTKTQKWLEITGRYRFKCPPYAECGVGWFPIIQETFEALTHLGFYGEVLKVGENHGSLRINLRYEGVPVEIVRCCERELSNAERRSNFSCEGCGALGTRRSILGNVVTLCDGCPETTEQP